MEDGTIELEYVAVKLDQDGYPEIPDLEGVKQTMFWYLLKMMILGGFTPPDKSITFRYCDDQVSHYVGMAKAELHMPSIAEMENIKNIRTSRIPITTHYRSAFRHLGNEEVLDINGRSRNSRFFRSTRFRGI